MRRPQSHDLRRGGERAVGAARRTHPARRGDLHHGLSADHEGVRRGVDLRRQRQHGFARLRHRARLSRSAHRSAARAAILQAASVCGQAARGRQDGALRRQDHALRRLVVDASAGRRRMDDRGRLGGLSELAAAQGDSPGDQERNARRRDRFRGLDLRRQQRQAARKVSAEGGGQLDQSRSSIRCATSTRASSTAS